MHQMIMLWGVPRSISTAFERYFIERKDHAIGHEIFTYPYYFGEGRQTGIVYQTINKDLPMTYESAKAWCYEQAARKPLFNKDMAFQPFSHIMDDEQFIKDCTHTFLIRNPENTIRSYYTMQKELTNEEIGFECSWKLFERITEVTGKKPLIVQAENLEDDPEGTMKAYCDYCNIPFIKEALYWEAGMPKEWEHWAEWHGDAAKVCGIQKNVEKFTFEIGDIPEVKAWYDYALPYYQKLKAEAEAMSK